MDLEDTLEDSSAEGPEAVGEDMNQVPLEFVMTGIYDIGNIDTGQESEFSGHNHLQDPDGPFPGTMYSHEVHKYHLNRLPLFFVFN